MWHNTVLYIIQSAAGICTVFWKLLLYVYCVMCMPYSWLWASRRRLSVCQPYDTTTQLTEGSRHISSVSIKTTLQLSRWQHRRSAMRENESSSCRIILVTMQCRVIVPLYQKLITSITPRNLQIVYFVGMSQQAVALVISRMWRLRHLTQVFYVISNIEVWNPTFWKNSKQPMFITNYYAVKGIIGNGQSSSQVCQRGHCLSYLVFVIFGTPLHYWGKKCAALRQNTQNWPKRAKIEHNFSFSMPKITPAWKKYACAGGGGGD